MNYIQNEIASQKGQSPRRHSVNSSIQNAKDSMSRKEILFICFPLIIIMIGVVVYEINSGLIPDVVVFPAALYFLVGSIVYGSKLWWHYPAGLFILLFIIVIFAMLLESVFGAPMVGGGSIKLLAAIGGALGIILSLKLPRTIKRSVSR